MKKFVSILLLMSLLFTLFAAVGQAATVVPKLYLNGLLLSPKVDPQIINNSTVVPVRVVSEGLGYDIEWDNTAKTATVSNGKDVIKLKLNDNIALVNNQKVKMDTPTSIIKGTTLVPLRFIGEQFGLKFEWNNIAKEVHMYQELTLPPEPTVPDVPTGKITAVSFDGVSALTVNYEGTVIANKPMILENPNRIVFDFLNTSYTNELSSQFKSGQVEAIFTDNPFVNSYRYSLFSNSPSTARLVLLLSNDTGYVITEKTGELRFEFLPVSEVPVDPTLPPANEGLPELPNPIFPPSVTDSVYHIVIDAGHGAKDSGAQSVLNRYEKEFNLSIALKIQALLNKESNIKVHLTRADDTFLELAERVKFAEALKANLFISVHANSVANSPNVTGTETYYSRANSKAFAEVVHKYMLGATGLKDRGVKQANYKVIKDTTMPAILLEAGFLSNRADSIALYSDAVQNKIAAGVVAGIKEYLKLK